MKVFSQPDCTFIFGRCCVVSFSGLKNIFLESLIYHSKSPLKIAQINLQYNFYLNLMVCAALIQVKVLFFSLCDSTSEKKLCIISLTRRCLSSVLTKLCHNFHKWHNLFPCWHAISLSLLFAEVFILSMTALNKRTSNTVLKITDTDIVSFRISLRSICLFYDSASVFNFAIVFLRLVLPLFIVKLSFIGIGFCILCVMFFIFAETVSKSQLSFKN